MLLCVWGYYIHLLIDEFSAIFFKMNAHVEITSIAMSKNDPKITKLDKYDVEANIEEVDNSEEQSVFKYGFTALSNPKNVRLAVEGIAKISGDAVERNEILEKDDNDVPKILTMIYHELFPTFFLLLALVSYMEASIFILIIVLFITGWMGMARMIRSESFAITHKPFIKVLSLANVS